MIKIAVVGATGNVGRDMLAVLHERKFHADEVVALASSRSVGKQVSFGDRILEIQDLAKYDFAGTNIALFSPGAKVSKEYAPIAASCGCIVIDNTSYFRMDHDVPLIIPEVNPQDLPLYKKKNIIANPNCSTVQMLVPLKPLHDVYKIKRIVVSTYQSVSGAGKDAMDELFYQTKRHYEMGSDQIQPKKFTKDISFNCIPHIDVFMEDGRTKEEWKMDVETKKILGQNIEVCATCVRVPVFVGHAESVNVEFEKPFQLNDIYDILHDAEGVIIHDRREDGGYITNKECVRTFPIYVSRIRVDNTRPNCLNMWIVADNVYGKGAALNSVQIAEMLVTLL